MPAKAPSADTAPTGQTATQSLQSRQGSKSSRRPAGSASTSAARATVPRTTAAPKRGCSSRRLRPRRPSPAASATNLCDTGKVRSGQCSWSMGKPAGGATARTPRRLSRRTTAAVAPSICFMPWRNCRSEVARDRLRTASGLSRTTRLIRERAAGKNRSTCSRSGSSSGSSRDATPASSAPASRQASTIQLASRVSGGAASPERWRSR